MTSGKRPRANDPQPDDAKHSEKTSSTPKGTSKPPTKKAKTSHSKRSQQQLISRFFTSTPVREKKPKAKAEAENDVGGSQPEQQQNTVEAKPLSQTPPQSQSQPQPQSQSQSQFQTQAKAQSHSQSIETTDSRSPSPPRHKPLPTSSLKSDAASSDSDGDDEVPVMRRRTRAMSSAEPCVTHRVALDLGSDDDEEEYNPQEKKKDTDEADDADKAGSDVKPNSSSRSKKKKGDGLTDADFVVADDYESEEDSDDGDSDVVNMCDEEGEDGETATKKSKGNHGKESNDKGKAGKPSRSTDASESVTLNSYALNRHDTEADNLPLPVNEKRRQQLIQKVGRMEANNWFRRSQNDTNEEDGGDGKGEGKDDLENRIKSKKSAFVAKTGKKAKTKYTPLETQYVALRQKHPGLVLVVECGYKYKLFDSDASVASKVLRVASYMDHNFLTASFPTHRLSHHVRRLVDGGYKVGVISQAETAALKKAGDTASKLFQRTLSAVYSKGTIIADGTLVGSPSQATSRAPASHIMAVREVVETGAKDNEKDGKASGPDRTGIAIASVDCATGEVLYDTFVDDVLRSELDARLVSIEPVELIASNKQRSKRTDVVLRAYIEASSARLETVNDSKFLESDELSTLNEVVKKGLNNSDKNMGLLCQAVLECLGALVTYLKQFKLDLTMRNVTEYKSYRSRRHMKVGADVMRNFEVFGNSNTGSVDGSLIALVNRTSTAFGSRQMRFWLSHPLINPYDISDRLQTVAYLRTLIDQNTGHSTHKQRLETHAHVDDGQSDVDTAIAQLIHALRSVPDLEQGLTRITCGKSSPEQLVVVLQAVENVGRRTDHLKSLTPGPRFPGLLKKLLEQVPQSEEVLEDPVVRLLNQRAVEKDQRHLLFDYSEEVEEPDDELNTAFKAFDESSEFMQCVNEVSKASTELKASLKAMDKLLKRLREKHSHPSWEWKKVAQEEFLLEVPTSSASRMPKSWTIISQTKAVKRFRPQEVVDGYDRVLRAREVVQVTSTRCWSSYLKEFGCVATKLRGLVRALMDIDCLAALARVSQMPGYCEPKIDFGNSNKGAAIRAIDARHALSELLPSCTSYIPNDVNLGSAPLECFTNSKDNAADANEHTKDMARAVVISGPNYGGKSSYARMTALLILLAQIGCFVPAKQMWIRPFDAIYARMGASDCLAKGLSSLMVELAETSRILSAATSRSLVVMDELGRGTSTHDGSAIAYATLDHLVSELRCVTLFVTHYPMVASLTSVYPEDVEACYMDYREEDDDAKQSDKGDPEGGSDDAKKISEVVALKREKKKRITLLYKLTRGVASSSYGINVARLAGLPLVILNDALEHAAKFEYVMKRKKEDDQCARLLHPEVWKSDDDVSKLLLNKAVCQNI